MNRVGYSQKRMGGTPELELVEGTHVTEQKRTTEVLTKALETEELDEKDYQIREALQLLALKNE